MEGAGRTAWLRAVLAAAGMLLAGGQRCAEAQFGPLPDLVRFELAEAVQLHRADSTVLAELERVKAHLDARQWDEAVETLRRVLENSEEKLVGVTERRYVSLRDYCHLQVAALPAEALKLYRSRVDPVARRWYEEGVAQHDQRLLSKVVEQAFASSWGDDALLALGEIALEQGDYTSARWHWERIIPARLPAEAPRTWPGFPDTNLDLAAVRARLVLVSILEGSAARAGEELAQFVRLHPEARGRLGGREVNYAEALGAMLAESAAWPQAELSPDWPTFAGSPSRDKVAPQGVDVGEVAWRVPLPEVATGDVSTVAGGGPALISFPAPKPRLGYHPVSVGDLVLVNDPVEIRAINVRTGRPAWGAAGWAIYRDQLEGVPNVALRSVAAFGAPQFTMTVCDGRLYSRMGNTVTDQPPAGAGVPSRSALGPGYLVCLDLKAEGRLMWKIAPEEGWAFEGSPVADGVKVYVGMRRGGVPEAHVACFDAQTGRRLWRVFVCGAETPARGMFPQNTHNLLTLDHQTLYYNTNLGAVAAISARDQPSVGARRLQWVSLYPRAREGSLLELAPHWGRDLNPCLCDHGMLLVAPADSPRIFALDEATGQILWQTGPEVQDVVHLLGTTAEHLIASGDRLYWIGLQGAERGRVKHVWPDGPDKLGYGRGVLAGDDVLWPTREKIYVFDQQTARQKKVIDLLPRGASGGNLLVAGGRMLIATSTELIALGQQGGSPTQNTDELTVGRNSALGLSIQHSAFSIQHSGNRLMLQEDDVQAVQELSEAYRLILEQLSRVIVGQQQVIEELLVAMFARGHCLLVGVPGLAKTLMIRTLADAMSLKFSRIQFTPDLMPADITGTEVIQEDKLSGTRELRFLQGPIFGNVILADEINRTPPKTQAALLEAMQEYQITAGGTRHRLSQPFFVLATQNPIEHEGTYPLPEAQLDRFMFNTYVDYPAEEEEFDIVRRTTADVEPTVTPTLSGEQILALQRIVRRVPAADHVIRYALQLTRLTRPDKGQAPEFVRAYVSWGAGPRASQYLTLGAKARAVLHGRFYASCDDVRAVAHPVLRHRIITNFNAEAEGVKPDDVVRRLIDTVAVEEDRSAKRGRFPEVFRSPDPGAA